MKLLYRAHLVLHTALMDICFDILPKLVSVVYGFIITALFTAIRIRKYVPLASVLCYVFGLTTCMALCIIYKLAYKITKHSSEFLEGFASSTSHVNRLENKKFFKSCQPIYIRIGAYTVISRIMFPCVLHGIILNALISLLLGIPVIEYV